MSVATQLSQQNPFYPVEVLECAPGRLIKLSELRPIDTTNKVCTVEVDAIPAGVTSWDDAINMNNAININHPWALDFGVHLIQASPSAKVTIGDKVVVYKYDFSIVQQTFPLFFFDANANQGRVLPVVYFFYVPTKIGQSP